MAKKTYNIYKKSHLKLGLLLNPTSLLNNAAELGVLGRQLLVVSLITHELFCARCEVRLKRVVSRDTSFLR